MGGVLYRNNARPAFPPTFEISQPPRIWILGRKYSIASPFENLAAARCPLIMMSWTVASRNDFRYAADGGVQFSVRVLMGADGRTLTVRTRPLWNPRHFSSK